jgi:hypothetical protein
MGALQVGVLLVEGVALPPAVEASRVSAEDLGTVR